jgi:predicted phage gp36 major capsid-like protein
VIAPKGLKLILATLAVVLLGAGCGFIVLPLSGIHLVDPLADQISREMDEIGEIQQQEQEQVTKLNSLDEALKEQTAKGINLDNRPALVQERARVMETQKTLEHDLVEKNDARNRRIKTWETKHGGLKYVQFENF